MAAQQGKALLLKIGNGAVPEVFTTIAGLRARSLSFNARIVDATDADSLNGWRELLAGAGVRSAQVSGTGVFRDAASDATLRSTFFAGTIATWQIVIPDFGTVQGPFQIAALEYSGEHGGEVTFALTLESAGSLSFTVL